MPTRCPNIRLMDGSGRLIVRDGLVLCFYLRHPHRFLAPYVADALKAYFQYTAPSTPQWYIDEEGNPAELSSQALQRILSELSDPSGWPNYTLQLEDSATGVSGYSLEYRGRSLDTPDFLRWPDAVSYISMTFPSELLDSREPASLRQFALQLADHLPFSYGYASHAFNYCAGAAEQDAFEEIRARCFDYPGMDVHYAPAVSLDIGDHARGAYWLNFLGEPLLGRLGGIEALRSSMREPGIDFTPLPAGRAMVALGPWPQAGDERDKEYSHLYRRLALALKDHSHLGRFPFPGFSEDETRRWVRRFVE